MKKKTQFSLSFFIIHDSFLVFTFFSSIFG